MSSGCRDTLPLLTGWTINCAMGNDWEGWIIRVCPLPFGSPPVTYKYCPNLYGLAVSTSSRCNSFVENASDRAALSIDGYSVVLIFDDRIHLGLRRRWRRIGDTANLKTFVPHGRQITGQKTNMDKNSLCLTELHEESFYGWSDR